MASGPARANADSVSFTTVNYPGATTTAVEGINSSGELVGIFTDSTGDHGFIDNGGTFTTINVPGGAAGTTDAFGINGSGQVVGSFFDSSSNLHGFLDSSGTFSQIDDTSAGVTGTGSRRNQQRWAGRGIFSPTPPETMAS